MRAIIYARVSTDEQGDNFSLPSQINACRTYATERGMQVVAEIQEAQSGAVLERPGLARVRELARQRQIDAVITYSLDRLSRNVAHTLLLRDELTEAGVTLHTYTRGQASDTPEGRMFDTLENIDCKVTGANRKQKTILEHGRRPSFSTKECFQQHNSLLRRPDLADAGMCRGRSQRCPIIQDRHHMIII
jgi:site-specific DNA recombinase